ncbi:MAG TPA: protoporphyrinogen oxidase HemJ [Caulobacteraceae bacterium]|jgi:putative membrane protein|nr:protoporphyrinogen oxidase HemJ [Caulobacteraceae bacterium]
MLIQIVKGLHIIAVIAWMAGLLYLPRLFVYHTRAAQGSEMAATFEVMESKLLGIIMNPAMIAVVILGGTLVWLEGWRLLLTPWMLVKLTGVLFLLWWHHYLARARKRLAKGDRSTSERFWRMMNETPFLAAAVIVLSVTTKYGG